MSYTLPAILLWLPANQHFDDHDLLPLVFGAAAVAIALYLAFGAGLGCIVAMFTRGAAFKQSAMIGMGVTVAAGFVCFGFLVLPVLLYNTTPIGDLPEVAHGVGTVVVLAAIVLAAMVPMVVLIRRVARNLPRE